MGMPSVPLNQTKMFNRNCIRIRSFANLSVIAEDEQQVGSTDHAVSVGVEITAVREAPVVSEHIQNVRGGDQAIAIDVSRTWGVVVRLMEALREVLSRDAGRARERLTDRSVEVDAAIGAGVVTGRDGVAPEDRLGGHLFGEQPAPGEQHGEEEKSLHGVLSLRVNSGSRIRG